jgi:hypothetical protein
VAVRTDNTGTSADLRGDRTIAQWFDLIVGAVLVIVGIAGFFVESDFGSVPKDASYDKLLGFEVNGWHNIVHIATGALLLWASTRADLAKRVTLAFGVVYALVSIIGLIQGDRILNIIPVNPADNGLHIALAALALIVGFMSPDTRAAGARY